MNAFAAERLHIAGAVLVRLSGGFARESRGFAARTTALHRNNVTVNVLALAAGTAVSLVGLLGVTAAY